MRVISSLYSQILVLKCPLHHLNYLVKSIWHGTVAQSWNKGSVLKDSIVKEVVCVEELQFTTDTDELSHLSKS